SKLRLCLRLRVPAPIRASVLFAPSGACAYPRLYFVCAFRCLCFVYAFGYAASVLPRIWGVTGAHSGDEAFVNVLYADNKESESAFCC
ncbi:hypothetical protein ACMD2_20582, partial [Ananas comosus]